MGKSPNYKRIIKRNMMKIFMNMFVKNMNMINKINEWKIFKDNCELYVKCLNR